MDRAREDLTVSARRGWRTEEDDEQDRPGRRVHQPLGGVEGEGGVARSADTEPLPIAMDDGLRFAIREGGRTVGAGVVAKIFE